MSWSMRYWRARTMTSRYASSASSNVAGWSALIRPTTVGSSASGSISRAAAMRASLCSASCCQPISRMSSASSPSNARRRDELVVALAPERPVVDARASVPCSQSAYASTAAPAAPRPARGGAARRRRGRRSPAATTSSNRLGSSRPSRSRARCHSRTCGHGRPRPALVEVRRRRLEAAGDRASRSASGAKSRANSRNSPSPTSSRAVDRRSQVRRTSVSKIARRRLWVSSSRSKRASADRPAGSSASMRRGGPARRRAPGGPRRGFRRRGGRRPSWRPEVRRRDRVVADEPPEAGLDEVVELLVERAGLGARRRAGQRERRGSVIGPPDVRAGGRRCMDRPAARAGRPAGSASVLRRRPAGGGLGERRRAVAAIVVSMSAASRRSGSRRGPGRGGIPPSATPRARSAVEERRPVALDLEQRRSSCATRAGSSGPGAGWAVPPADDDAVHPGRAPRPGGGRWRGPRRGARSCRPGRRDRATSPAAARTPAWRIPPPTSLRARRARQMKSRGPTTTEPTGQASALRQAERDGVGRAGEVRSGGRPGRRPRSRTGRRRCGAGRRARRAIAATARRVGGASAAGPSSGRGCSRW